MAERVFRRTNHWRLVVLTLVLLTGSGLSGALAAPPAKNFSADEIYTALIEPALSTDGRITSEQRQTILKVARKILDDRQLQELETRLAAYAVVPVRSETASPSSEPVANPKVFSLGPELMEQAKPGHDSDPLAPDILHPACDHPAEGLFDNLSLFAGLDGSKQPQDLGINANFGWRFAANWGFSILESLGLGGQIGTSINQSLNAVHVIDQIEGTNIRNQYFTTVGLLERTSWGLNVGLAYDFLSEKYYEHFDLGQWRGQAGYELNDENEVGSWFTVRDRGDSGSFLGTPVHLRPLSQVNVFWRHLWPNNAETAAWVGVAQGHGRVVFVFPENSTTTPGLAFGAEVNVPLNNWISLYGAANFITPADTGTVDAFLGIAIYPRGGAQKAHQRRFAPLLPVANNPTFAVDLRR